MSIRRLYPNDSKELLNIFARYADKANCVVVQAGHFLLYYDHTEARLLPGIAETLDGPRHALFANEIGHYPLLTWRIALQSLAALEVRRRCAMVVVNDWQYLPEGVDRLDFYRHYSLLPESYQRMLAAYPSVELLSPSRKPNLDTGSFFSEQTLRNAYEKHVKTLIRQGALPENVYVERSHRISCSLLDSRGHKTKDIYCSDKRQNCTHEVAELIWTVHALTKADVFINFFPLVCKEYMLEGTELSHELFRHAVGKVINVGMPSSHIRNKDDLFSGAEVIVHDFL